MEPDHGATGDVASDSQVVGRVDMQSGSRDPLVGASPVMRVAAFLLVVLIMVAAILLILHHVFTR